MKNVDNSTKKLVFEIPWTLPAVQRTFRNEFLTRPSLIALKEG